MQDIKSENKINIKQVNIQQASEFHFCVLFVHFYYI